MKSLVVVLMSFMLLSSNLFANELKNTFKQSIDLDFRAYEDSLCFANHGFYEHTGNNPYLMLLGSIADKEGSCQGMVGVAAAVKTRVIFRSDKKKMSKRKIAQKLRQAVHLHQNDCRGKVYIDGYANLREMCNEQETALKRRSLQYNLSLARKEILKYSWSFFNRNVLNTERKRTLHLKEHLTSMYQDLKKGSYPLMLVRNHVTLVVGMDVEKDNLGNPVRITLKHYDPNVIMSSEKSFYHRSYTLSPDGESIRGQLIWNITPRPLTRLYCPFIGHDKK